MSRLMIRSTARLALFFVALVPSLSSVAQDRDSWEGVERIIAVGDIHGDYDHYIEVLRDAKLVNRRGNWIAGETHFVQMGDLPDRGPDTDKIIAHMQKLEEQAEEAGGHVHALIGNHEIMNIYGDLRYVHPNEYRALRSSYARELRNSYYEQHVQQVQLSNPEIVIDGAYRKRFNDLYPLGYVEHRMFWASNGEYGSWVAQHNAILKIDRTLFVHGGISPDLLAMNMSISEINDQIRSEIQGNLPEEGFGLSESDTGPLWYRGLANNDVLTEGLHVDAVLQAFDVDRVVIGHTPRYGTVMPRFGAKVLVIDTGISEYYGAHVASLLIEAEEISVIQRGEIVTVPQSDDALLPYFERILELEPDAGQLEELITTLRQ